jgi:futalosine hydrolase
VTALLVTATGPERDAALRHVDPSLLRRGRCGPFPVLHAGTADVVVCRIGPAAAATATATALALGDYVGVVSLGICGGFPGAAQVGDTVVATDLVAADLGAESPDGFLGLDQLGWAEQSLPVPTALVHATAGRLRAAGLAVVTGPVVSVSSVTGTDARAAELAHRHGAVAEAMEGRAVADAAAVFGVPALEVRTVSNAVGRRDTSAWRFDLALAALATAGAALLAEELPWPR